MIIDPDPDRVDDFTIHLSSQELRNILTGLVDGKVHGGNSPWVRGTIGQIERALADNREYRSRRWRT